MIGDAERATPLAFAVLTRRTQHHDRRTGDPGLVADSGRHLEAVHFRHVGVEEHELEWPPVSGCLLQRLQRLGAAGHAARQHLLPAQEIVQHPAVDAVVVDNERADPGQIAFR